MPGEEAKRAAGNGRKKSGAAITLWPRRAAAEASGGAGAAAIRDSRGGKTKIEAIISESERRWGQTAWSRFFFFSASLRSSPSFSHSLLGIGGNVYSEII